MAFGEPFAANSPITRFEIDKYGDMAVVTACIPKSSTAKTTITVLLQGDSGIPDFEMSMPPPGGDEKWKYLTIHIRQGHPSSVEKRIYINVEYKDKPDGATLVESYSIEEVIEEFVKKNRININMAAGASCGEAKTSGAVTFERRLSVKM
jgi:hypothetical protein